ncbi:MAG TPA: AfsR family transcriptional regulator, partial [Dactylosporangium sp.]|nr:AfsR family transcriptional regulator [Dactylosporangium sp.]
EAGGHYRALLRRRRVLVVLDNAAGEAQVRPLLPGDGASMALVTSRRALSGLEGVHRIALGMLPAAEAGLLLARLLGDARAASERAALDELVALCGGLPLALRIAGNRLASRPGWRVAELVERLGGPERLSRLTAGSLQVAGPLLVSYRQLSAPARRLLRRLALVPGPDFGTELARLVADFPADAAVGAEEAVEDALDELVELGLLQPGAGVRYRFHDLIRFFAGDRLQREEPDGPVEAARERMHEWLLDAAIAAGRWFEPDWGRAPAEPVPMVALDTAEDARRWLQAELPNWFGALRAAARQGRHRRVVDVAEAMHWFSDQLLWWPHWLEVYERSAAAARELGDPGLVVTHLNYHAWAVNTIGRRPVEAIELGRRALRMAEEIGDVREQGWAWAYIGYAAITTGDGALMLEAGRAAAERFGKVGYWDGYVSGLSVIAYGLRRLGRAEEALAVLRGIVDAPAVSRTLAGPILAHTRRRCGEIEAELGRWPEAAASLAAAAPYFRASGQRAVEAATRALLASALAELGRAEEAAAERARSEELHAQGAG